MEINWLNDFIALAETQNFSRAAEVRHVSQPAFSRRIRALETFVGATLINRDTLPLSLTPAGNLFLEQSKAMLQTLEDSLEQCRAIESEDENILRIAASQSIYTTYHSALIQPYVDRGILSVDLASVSWPVEKFVAKMQQGTCDLMLCYWHPSMSFLSNFASGRFKHLTVARDRFVPVSKSNASGDPIFTLPNTSKSRTPLISYGSASVLRPVVDEIILAQSCTSSTLLVSQNALSSSVRALIEGGFGLGWLPSRVYEGALQSGTLSKAGSIDFETDLEIRIYCSLQNQKPKLQIFWDELKDIYQP